MNAWYRVSKSERYSALRKCKNVVFAGVLSPLSFAIERKGAVGDKKEKIPLARLIRISISLLFHTFLLYLV